MGDNRLTLLGCGTCELDRGRAASSALIELDDLRLVFDFGHGVAARLVELGLRQDDLRHVVLSHFHTDHFSDLLPYLHAASHSRSDPRTEDLHLYLHTRLADRFERLLDVFRVGELVGDRYRLRVHRVAAGELEIEDRLFELRELPPAGNHGLRFTLGSTTAALTGDSFFHDREVDFLRDVDLAIIDSGHLTDDEIVELAVRSGAARIVCSHLYREPSVRELERAAQARGFDGTIELASDLATWQL